MARGYVVRSFAFSGYANRPSCDAETAVSGDNSATRKESPARDLLRVFM